MHLLSAIRAIMLCLMIAQFSCLMVKSDECDVEITETLRTLLDPQENDSMQIQSLRRQLLRKFQEALDLAELEDMKNYKRNIGSLAAYNNFPEESKRNVEALARHGQWYKTPPELNDDDSNYKRSISNLAKNDQLPLTYLQPGNQKRGIEALARNGDLHHPRNYRALRELLEDMYDKRTISSLMRNYNPPGTTAGFGKRSLSSLAKAGEYPHPKRINNNAEIGKREAGKYEETVIKEGIKDGATDFEKRNIQSIMAHSKPGSRSKRQAPDYYDDDNIFQGYSSGNTLSGDYDDWQQSPSDDIYPVENKRFLGSLVKNGWSRRTNGDMSRFYETQHKRHLGSLARLGWLPGYRSIRRFSRSGRSTSSTNGCGLVNGDREIAPNGKTTYHSYSKVTTVPLEDKKRYLLQPAVDNILLRKMFIHPRMMRF